MLLFFLLFFSLSPPLFFFLQRITGLNIRTKDNCPTYPYGARIAFFASATIVACSRCPSNKIKEAEGRPAAALGGVSDSRVLLIVTDSKRLEFENKISGAVLNNILDL